MNIDLSGVKTLGDLTTRIVLIGMITYGFKYFDSIAVSANEMKGSLATMQKDIASLNEKMSVSIMKIDGNGTILNDHELRIRSNEKQLNQIKER